MDSMTDWIVVVAGLLAAASASSDDLPLTGSGSTADFPHYCDVIAVANADTLYRQTLRDPFASAGTTVHAGGAIRYTCHEGYRLDGNEEIECLLDRPTFDGQPPNCTLKELPRETSNFAIPVARVSPHACTVIQVANAAALYLGDNDVMPADDTVPAGGTISYACHEGFRMVGSPEIICRLEQPVFDRPPPQCNPSVLNCPLPETPPHALRQGEVNILGSLIVFTCEDGFELQGTDKAFVVRTCLPSGVFSGSAPVCLPQRKTYCDEPGIPVNGGLMQYSNEYIPGTTVLLFCRTGYRMIGVGFRTCQDDFTFSGSNVGCVATNETETEQVRRP